MPFDNTVMGFTRVTQQHFDLARAYFRTYPAENHLSRKDSFWLVYTKKLTVENSFIYDRENNVLYAKEDTHTRRPGVKAEVTARAGLGLKGKYYTGMGAFGLFKLLQAENGGMLGLKIARPAGCSEAERAEAKEAMRRVGVLYFSFERKSTTQKRFFIKYGNDIKEYELQKWENGLELREYIVYKTPSTLSLLKIALLAMRAVHELHAQNIIHGDLKEESMKLYKNPDGSYSHVRLIDHGFARILADGQESVSGTKLQGTLGLMAPEIRLQQVFSKASDIYALGAGFVGNIEAKGSWPHYNDDHWFSLINNTSLQHYPDILNIFQKMTAVNPKDRPLLSTVMAVVEKHLLEVAHDAECTSFPSKLRL